MNQIIFKLENHVGENQPHKTQKKWKFQVRFQPTTLRTLVK